MKLRFHWAGKDTRMREKKYKTATNNKKQTKKPPHNTLKTPEILIVRE